MGQFYFLFYPLGMLVTTLDINGKTPAVPSWTSA